MATSTKTNNQTTTTVNMAPLLLILSRFKEDAGQSLGENEKLKGELNSKIDRIIKGIDVTTTAENANELAGIISKSSELRNDSGIGVMAKRIELEAKKLIEQYPKEIEELKKEDFKENFDKELAEKNPNLDQTQLKDAREYRDLVAKDSFKKSIIDDQQNEALEANKEFGAGKLENAWTDLKTTVNFLQKSPEGIKSIKEKYNSLKGKLDGVNLPTGSKEARSFERVMSVLNNPNADDLFSKTRKYLGWADRVDKLTGGWLNKTVTDVGVKVFEKVGNQAIQEFATNALGQMAEHGFQQGFSNILNGVLSGGVKKVVKKGVEFGVKTGAEMGAKAVVQTGAKVVVGTGAEAVIGTAGGAATGGILTIAMIALEAVKAIKKAGNAIAEKLGISSKKFLEENFGKGVGTVLKFIVAGATTLLAIPALIISAIFATISAILLPVMIVVVTVFTVFTFLQNSIMSILEPTNETTVEIPIAAVGNNSTGKYPSASTYEYLGQLGTVINQYGVSLPIFEKEGGSLVTTFYDIGKIENGIWLEKFPNGGNCLLDKRMIPVYLAMVAQAGKEGISESYFALTSDCYRSYELQKSIYDPSLANGRTIAKNQGINISDWTDFEIARLGHGGVGIASPGHSAHMTGRAVDATNLGTKGLNWMKANGSKFGFYKNSKEDWHWEYNPSS